MNEPSGPITSDQHDPLYQDMAEHQHWAQYDMSLEGCLMNRLHVTVSERAPDMALFATIQAELLALAQNKGYGEQDSFSTEQGRLTPKQAKEPYHQARAEQFADDPDSEYTNAIDRSILFLAGSAATEEAWWRILALGPALHAARIEGRKIRLAMEQNSKTQADTAAPRPAP